MPSVPNITVPPAPAAPDNRTDPAKIENAAKQFESLLMAQILKSMHEDGSGGWMGTGDDASADSSMELAEEQFAQALSSRGGLGLSRIIVQGLTPKTPAVPVNVTPFTKP